MDQCFLTQPFPPTAGWWRCSFCRCCGRRLCRDSTSIVLFPLCGRRCRTRSGTTHSNDNNKRRCIDIIELSPLFPLINVLQTAFMKSHRCDFIKAVCRTLMSGNKGESSIISMHLRLLLSLEWVVPLLVLQRLPHSGNRTMDVESRHKRRPQHLQKLQRHQPAVGGKGWVKKHWSTS